jgi:serine/threonine protein kinase
MVKFLGITRSPANLKNSKLPPDTLFLVSEFGLEGDGRELVKRCLNGTPQDWDMILRFVGDIASGLNDIHSHGVLHRDLHWGNILGTTKRFDRQLLPMIRDGQVRDDAETSVELLIADLGEGKIVGKTSTLGRQYGNAEFRAPEVQKYGSKAYTTASDMYAMGRLAEDIVTEYWEASERVGDHRRLISQTLRDLIPRLKSEDPDLRPSAKEVRDAIQDVWRKGMAGAWDFDPHKIDLLPYEEQKAEATDIVEDEIP